MPPQTVPPAASDGAAAQLSPRAVPLPPPRRVQPFVPTPTPPATKPAFSPWLKRGIAAVILAGLIVAVVVYLRQAPPPPPPSPIEVIKPEIAKAVTDVETLYTDKKGLLKDGLSDAAEKIHEEVVRIQNQQTEDLSTLKADFTALQNDTKLLNNLIDRQSAADHVRQIATDITTRYTGEGTELSAPARATADQINLDAGQKSKPDANLEADDLATLNSDADTLANNLKKLNGLILGEKTHIAENIKKDADDHKPDIAALADPTNQTTAQNWVKEADGLSQPQQIASKDLAFFHNEQTAFAAHWKELAGWPTTTGVWQDTKNDALKRFQTSLTGIFAWVKPDAELNQNKPIADIYSALVSSAAEQIKKHYNDHDYPQCSHFAVRMVEAPDKIGDATVFQAQLARLNRVLQALAILQTLEDANAGLIKNPHLFSDDTQWKQDCVAAIKAAEPDDELSKLTSPDETKRAASQVYQAFNRPTDLKTGWELFQNSSPTALPAISEQQSNIANYAKYLLPELLARRACVVEVNKADNLAKLTTQLAATTQGHPELIPYASWICWLKRDGMDHRDPNADLAFLAAIGPEVIKNTKQIADAAKQDVTQVLKNISYGQKPPADAVIDNKTLATLGDNAVKAGVDEASIHADLAMAQYNSALRHYLTLMQGKTAAEALNAFDPFKNEAEAEPIFDKARDQSTTRRVQAVNDSLRKLATPPPPSGPDYGKAGPGGSSLAGIQFVGNPDGAGKILQFTVPTARKVNAGQYDLNFIKVTNPGKDFYLCTTAAPVGLFIDAVNANGKVATAQNLMNLGDFPAISAWKKENNWIDVASDGHWYNKPNVGPVINVDFGGKAAGVGISGANPLSPMQFVTPAAAAYAASLLNCRLPTHEEWIAAALSPDLDIPANENLRGKNLKSYVENVAGTDYVNQFHDAILHRLGLEWDDLKDGTREADAVWFRAVTDPNKGTKFRDLRGNISAWVWQDDKFVAKPNFDALVTGNLAAFSANFARIGESMLTPEQDSTVDAHKTKTYHPVTDTDHYCDVGFRLAFDAPMKESTVAAAKPDLSVELAKLFLNPGP